ncbi:hypothetical protein [Butyrivibrio sp. YAB3001]|uniref:hypothetical protein n=1 Tax=Butyrivibrio sp. YAB3001 TaxID=1520812 RepID=UPI0008F641CE|nr:hypothetical protein [Butyrivibrio sp. YAB3001]SFD12611.1 hypothetical protein SAMN02910398_04134 [Butyrivibrio sp. YAB3001]
MKKIKKILLLLCVFVLVSLNCNGITSYAATGNPIGKISDVKSNNHNFNSATTIPANKYVQGRVEDNSPSKADYYKYKTTEKGYVQFKVSRIKKKYEYLCLYVYDANNKLLWEKDNIQDVTTTFKMNFKKGTTYYLRVKARGYSSEYDAKCDEYLIWAVETKAPYMEVERNDNFSQASALTLNKNATGIIMDENDSDYFKFKAPENGTYKFTFNYSTGEDIGEGWNMFFYNQNAEELKRKEKMLVKTTFSKKMKKGETAYIVLKCASSYYSRPIFGETYTVKVTKK